MARSVAVNRHGAGGALARGLIALAAFLFPLGVMLPMMETRRFLLWKDSYSLLDTISALWASEEIALAALITLFSLVTPPAKALVLMRLHLADGPVSSGLLAWVERLGKWSLTDVLVVAVAMVMWSSSGLASAASQPGLWFFAASGVLLMLASGLVTRDLLRRVDADEEG